MHILFDIGGTRMRVVGTRDGESFAGEPIVCDTPAKFEDGLALLQQLTKEVAGSEDVGMLVGGVTGVVDRVTHTIVRSPHLPDWAGKQLPVNFLENDSAMVGLGEAVAGAGAGYPIVVYLTVSTGVGGVRIVQGQIDASRMGFEPGHQIISLTDHRSLEEYISGSALMARYGKRPADIMDESIWDEVTRMLATGVYNTLLHWSPDVLVLGGSMVIKKPGISTDHLRGHLDNLPNIFPDYPPIREASLGDFGGLHGSLAYLKRELGK